MAQHSSHHHSPDQHHGLHRYGGGHTHHDAAGLAELLDLDAEVLATYLAAVTGWTRQHAPELPRTVVDLGAGTGAGSLALARRFETAAVVAVDRSAVMLERVRAAAREQGLAGRLRVVQADLDVAWPEVGAVDIAWAASSLHEVADPERVLRDAYAALNPGGLLVVIEMDTLPRFLPDDVGTGRPGLESRCHEALAQADWNRHPDWRPHLEQAGFQIAAQRSFSTEAGQASPGTGRYAQAYLRLIRPALDGRLGAEDLDTLDHLLAEDGPHALLRRRDLAVRGTRTAWAARRP
ncbi:class I SAM-dependent methyltransferase [Arthrobacter mobilis]|uniref:Class I SAM-dependent methyltransferase n=1 Tax=Arthrobacter mobilis TaxID=2724944 RepID=A0A7X6K5Q1_9MICC|nr:class I SAM-dependent methyltransferase [Arthrobacter mobilis]NKX54534.1 class I SAM-dependent methyltransferase [Arthrobacter mobilis]